MAKVIKTYLFCYDDHRAFSEDVRKRFSDADRYKVFSFPTKEEFLASLVEAKDKSNCKIAMLGVHDNTEQIAMIEQLTMEVNKIDHRTGLILLGSVDRMEEIKNTIKFNIDAFIPKNSNSILRIHNTVKKLVSEHNMGVYRKRRNFSIYVILSFVLFSAVCAIIAYFKYPHYF